MRSNVTLAMGIGVLLMGVSAGLGVEPLHWNFREGRLDNGLRVLTLENRRAPIVHVQVWYHVGSKDEDPERQGFAHLFEHMMFRGTDRIGPQDHFRYLQRYGSSVNGYTSFDQTVYWQTVPASQLDLALWLEAERLANLKINEDYFAAEREVVKEERRMRYLNRPYGQMFETLFDAAFTEHPYRWTPIGNMEHLDAATTDELHAFFRMYYVPNNATLVVTGDVGHDDVMASAERYFGPIVRRDDPPRVTTREPELSEPRRVEITDRAPSPRVILAYHAPSARDREAIPLDILAKILSSGQSSRLYRALVQDEELAVSVAAFDYTMEQAGLFMLSATLKPDVAVEDGERALLQTLGQVLEDGVTQRELEKARNQAVAEYVRKGVTIKGQADNLGYAAVVLGDVNRVNTDLAHLRAVTAEEIQRVGRRVFEDHRRITLIIRPDPNPPEVEPADDKSGDTSEAVVDLDPPEDMPVGHAPKPTDLPFPVVRKLSNGLRVAVFTDTAVPAVSVAFNLLTGAKHDPPELAGLAHVTANTLRRGTQRHSGEELAELIDFHAMSLSESVGHEDTGLTLWTLREHLPLAVQVLAEVVREPTFPEREIAGFASRASAAEAIREEDPGTIATRAFNRALFDSHYLGRPSGGTAASLRRISRDDVVAFHGRFYAPDIATIIFSGDVTPDDAVALVEARFGDWQASVESVASSLPPARTAARVVRVQRDRAVQSEIRIGQVVPLSRRDPDYAAARMLSHLFGESFSGRLNRSLRIERGLTYGARGYFDVDTEAAAFRISTFTRTERTIEAIDAALAEVERLGTGDITEEELEAARDAIIGRFQISLETPAQIAGAWWNLTVWDLPETWYGHYLRSVAGVDDPRALADVALRTITPDRMAIVVVGDTGAIEADLRRIAPVDEPTAESEQGH